MKTPSQVRSRQLTVPSFPMPEHILLNLVCGAQPVVNLSLYWRARHLYYCLTFSVFLLFLDKARIRELLLTFFESSVTPSITWSTQEKIELEIRTELQWAEERNQITGVGPEFACGKGSWSSSYDRHSQIWHFIYLFIFEAIHVYYRNLRWYNKLKTRSKNYPYSYNLNNCVKFLPLSSPQPTRYTYSYRCLG